MNWLDKFKKSYSSEEIKSSAEIEQMLKDSMVSINDMSSMMSSTFDSSIYGASAIGSGGGGSYISINPAATTAAAGHISGGYTYTTYPSMGATGVSMGPPNNLIQFNANGKEIVRLNLDGSVTWADGINVDEAADAFGKSLSLSAEVKSGISKRAKLRIRDSVFTDLISIAKEKGSLTAEDLTYLLEASKIVEKLKGDYE